MTDALRMDLTRPPDRQVVGMSDGNSYVSYEYDNRRPFRVELLLPGDVSLAVEARLLTLDSLARPDPETGPPSTLDLHTYPTTLDNAYEQLLAAARRFNLDTAPIADWYQKASGPAGAAPGDTIGTGWLSAQVDYLRVQVRGGYKPPINDTDTGQTTVHYVLAW